MKTLRRTAFALLCSLLVSVSAGSIFASTEGSEEASPSVLLVTVDTVRADAVGAYGGAAGTPTLDALAARGVRYERALSPSPLTLPAHTSLLTGFDPPQHGVRDNGIDALPSDIPTLATIFGGEGYRTGAFVSSRVLDRRFGLSRGFDFYGDDMAAENVGQYGYPERDGAAVTEAALAWISAREPGRPDFLWVHFYDAHAPYEPPPPFRAKDVRANYYGEIAFVDSQIARLLEAFGPDAVVAIVGDHGEMLGEHGEEGHGIFVYEAALRVPLILAGGGLPVGKVVEQTVGTVQLASTLLLQTGVSTTSAERHPGLPGLGEGATFPVFSEALLPANAYGWSPLTAISEDRWRFISAPRPELYDVRADPSEARDLSKEKADVAARLAAALEQRIALYGEREGADVSVDGDLDASLRSLGYLSTSGAEASDIDPKDGIRWLAERDEAKRQMAAGRFDEAAKTLRRLVQLNPQNQTFLAQYARALFGLGRKSEGVEVYRRAVAANPKLDFLHVNLAQALLETGKTDEAEEELRLALELNPRSSSAALALGQLLARSGRGAEERAVLQAAADAGTESSAIHVRLGQFASRDREYATAERHFEAATRLSPGMSIAWLLRAMNSEAAGRLDDASDQYRATLDLDAGAGTALFRYGRLLARRGDTAAATPILRRALSARLGADERREVEQLLRELGAGG